MIKSDLSNSCQLSKYTTLKVGGFAEFFAEPTSIDETKSLIYWAKKENISCNIIGAGSNLLISDNLIKGLTISIKRIHGNKFNKETGEINVNAGEPLPLLSRKAAKLGLKGLEWAVGIPGTIGGATVMNAGAQGGCINDCIASVLVVPLDGGEEYQINRKELNYSYRSSILQEKQVVVLSAKLILEPGHNKKILTDITNQNLKNRTDSQPYHLPNCGSVFRNPEPLKAGRLIESVGLKGFRIGGAEISDIHANFIVNKGNACAEDVNKLITLAQNRVKQEHNIELRTEIKRLGFDFKL
mgnify:CR=1 FL=1